MTSSPNDRKFDLIFKLAYNLYVFAGDVGASGLTPPNLNDSEFTLWKKAAYYSAAAKDAWI